jgi:DNA-binding NtrC family response regulator
MKVIDPTISITQSAIDRLAELDWHGNIRELRNAMSRLSLDEDRSLIDEAAVNFMLGQSRNENSLRNKTATEKPDNEHLKDNLHDVQLAQVLAVYAETGKNISKTARKLGVSRNTIYRTLRDQHK